MSVQPHKRLKASSEAVDRNLAGQRLGRKGQETRERILAAALRLFGDPDGPPVTLTNIAREADIRLTNLYLYFPDFEALLLAVLHRVMETAEEAYLFRLRTRWPDHRLGECCSSFLWDHYRFWQRHARLLHLRNHIADTAHRLRQYRQDVSRPLIDLLVFQMTDDVSARPAHVGMAMVLLVAFERVATVVTGQHFGPIAQDRQANALIAELIESEARLLELAIRDRRVVVQTPRLVIASR